MKYPKYEDYMKGAEQSAVNSGKYEEWLKGGRDKAHDAYYEMRNQIDIAEREGKAALDAKIKGATTQAEYLELKEQKTRAAEEEKINSYHASEEGRNATRRDIDEARKNRETIKYVDPTELAKDTAPVNSANVLLMTARTRWYSSQDGKYIESDVKDSQRAVLVDPTPLEDAKDTRKATKLDGFDSMEMYVTKDGWSSTPDTRYGNPSVRGSSRFEKLTQEMQAELGDNPTMAELVAFADRIKTAQTEKEIPAVADLLTSKK